MNVLGPSPRLLGLPLVHLYACVLPEPPFLYFPVKGMVQGVDIHRGKRVAVAWARFGHGLGRVSKLFQGGRKKTPHFSVLPVVQFRPNWWKPLWAEEMGQYA